jgi:hypothetical protein
MKWKRNYGFRLGITVWVANLLTQASHGGITLGTAFTYQGQLKNDGVPLNGTADLRFTLWNNAVGGVPIGASQFRTNHPVTHGLFNVELHFGQNAFDGNARWLEIAVRFPPGVGEYTPIAPRQPISPTPYAIFALSAAGLQLPFAGSANSAADVLSITNEGSGKAASFTTDRTSNVATIEGLQRGLGRCAHFHISNATSNQEAMAASSAGSGAAVWGWGQGTGPAGTFLITGASNASHALVASTTGTGYGVSAEAPTRGVYGKATNTTGAIRGVVGDTLSTTGRGVQGYASTTSGANYGVWGGSNSSEGTGVHGVNLDSDNAGSLGGPDYGVRSDGHVVVDNGAVRVTSPSDAEPSGGGGGVVIGPTTGSNVAIDGNEIMARNNGATSTLFLNNDSGDVVFGGAIDIGYEIVFVGFGGISGEALCPAGKEVIGGGCGCGLDAATNSYPEADRWICRCDDTLGAAYAICANVK